MVFARPWDRFVGATPVLAFPNSGNRPRTPQSPYRGVHRVIWVGVSSSGWADDGGSVSGLDLGINSPRDVFAGAWHLAWMLPPNVPFDQLYLQNLGWEHLIGRLLEEIGGNLATYGPTGEVASILEMLSRLKDAGFRIGDVAT